MILLSNRRNERKIKTTFVSGYAWSGSSAIVDLLREFKGYMHFEPEFRLLTDPGGIMDLENAIVSSKSYTLIDKTIREFQKLILIYSRDFHWWSNVKLSRLFEKIGFKYNKYMFNDFRILARDYLENLIDLEYKGELITNFYTLNRIKFLMIKFNYFFHRIIKKKMNVLNKIYYSTKNQKEFLNITKDFMDNICISIIGNQNINNIVLDQAVQPTNVLKGMRYFNNVKSIIVDRDPRDIFVQSYNFLYNTSIPIRDVNHFIKWFDLTRKSTIQDSKSDNVLKIQFEDLILNYNKTVKIIYEFLGETAEVHIMKSKYLNPEISKNNIKLWEKFSEQDLIKRIESNLSDFCWNS